MNSRLHPRHVDQSPMAGMTPAPSPASMAPQGPAVAVCGWYESSLALRQGLQVIELDASAAARWFGALLAPAQPAPLQ